MGLSKRLMAVGIPAQTAIATNGTVRVYASVSTTVTLAGATVITDDINIVPSAQAAGAMSLPSDAVVSDFVTVTNFTGNNITIFAPLGLTINNVAGATGVTLATSSSAQYQLSTSGWYIT